METILEQADREMRQTAFHKAGLLVLAGALWAIGLVPAEAQTPALPPGLATQPGALPQPGQPPRPSLLTSAAPQVAPLAAPRPAAIATPGGVPAAAALPMAVLPEAIQTDTLTLSDIQSKLIATPDVLSLSQDRLRDLDMARSIIQKENSKMGTSARGAMR